MTKVISLRSGLGMFLSAGLLFTGAQAYEHKNVVAFDKNPLEEALLTTLRDVTTDCAHFQEATNLLANFLVYKAASCLSYEQVTINTPLCAFDGGRSIKKQPILVPVMRAGLSLLPAFQKYFKGASTGFFGLKRDEETAEAVMYYENIPPIVPDDHIIILEPMLATGGSLVLAISELIAFGATEKNIIITSVIGAPEGVTCLEQAFPDVNIILGSLDEQLNDVKYIVPGLGDFGDRYFGNDAKPEFKALVK